MTTQRKLPLAAAAGGNAVGYVQLHRVLSRENHRLYREGRNYCVKVNADPNATTAYTVYALRDDWQVHNAWKLAMQTWMNNSKEEMEVLKSQGGVARWLDFQTIPGISGAGTTELRSGTYTITGGTPTFVANTSGEFNFSEVRNEAGNTNTFTWGTAGVGQWSILAEYDRVANQSANPETPLTQAAYGSLDDDKQDGQLEHLSGDGNLPPYNATGIEAASPWTKIATIGAGASGAQQLSTGYFNAPCGMLVIVAATAWDGTNQEVMVEFKEGKYKGVHAPTMGTAKLVKNHYEVK